MSNYSSAPTYDQPLIVKGNTSSVWYRFLVNGVWQGSPPSAETALSVSTAPFIYTAPAKGFLIVSSGTVSAIQFSRQGTYLLPFTSGIVPISKGDIVTITYTVKPTVVYVPQ